MEALDAPGLFWRYLSQKDFSEGFRISEKGFLAARFLQKKGIAERKTENAEEKITAQTVLMPFVFLIFLTASPGVVAQNRVTHRPVICRHQTA